MSGEGRLFNGRGFHRNLPVTVSHIHRRIVLTTVKGVKTFLDLRQRIGILLGHFVKLTIVNAKT